MDLAALARLAEAFVRQDAGNRIAPEVALDEALAGEQMYEPPLIGVADADDELFEAFLKPEAIGPHFLPPRAWLPGARSVVALFLPFARIVRESNRGGALPSAAWLHARIEGQAFIARLSGHLRDALMAEGHACVTPLLDARFRSVIDGEGGVYTSNWSERHAAYACGLGTFGLSKGLISRRGVAGRYASLIVDCEYPITPRAYQGLYEYCAMCGQCGKNCPAGAISLTTGKDHHLCAQYVARMGEVYAPRYGCGKCQVGVPCERAACKQ